MLLFLFTQWLTLLFTTLRTATSQQTNVNPDTCWTSNPATHSFFTPPWGIIAYSSTAVLTLESCKLICWSNPDCYSIDWDIDFPQGINCWMFIKDAPTSPAGSSTTHYTVNRACFGCWNGPVSNAGVNGGYLANGINQTFYCQKACYENASCVGIDFNNQSQCWLILSNNQLTAMDGVMHYTLFRNCADGSLSVSPTVNSRDPSTTSLRTVTSTVTIQRPPSIPSSTTASSSVTSDPWSSCNSCCDLATDTDSLISTDRIGAGIGIGIAVGVVVATSVAVTIELIRRRKSSSSEKVSSATTVVVSADNVVYDNVVYEDPPLNENPPYSSLSPGTRQHRPPPVYAMLNTTNIDHS